jgi:hypothetical protein
VAVVADVIDVGTLHLGDPHVGAPGEPHEEASRGGRRRRLERGDLLLGERIGGLPVALSWCTRVNTGSPVVSVGALRVA